MMPLLKASSGASSGHQSSSDSGLPHASSSTLLAGLSSGPSRFGEALETSQSSAELAGLGSNEPRLSLRSLGSGEGLKLQPTLKASLSGRSAKVETQLLKPLSPLASSRIFSNGYTPVSTEKINTEGHPVAVTPQESGDLLATKAALGLASGGAGEEDQAAPSVAAVSSFKALTSPRSASTVPQQKKEELQQEVLQRSKRCPNAATYSTLTVRLFSK